jgi:DNA polymerase III sliding clamp (beta) subunit (PCNA family)
MKLDRLRLQNVLAILGTAVGNRVMDAANYVCFRIDKQNRTVVLLTTDFHAFLAVDFGDVSLAEIDDAPDTFMIDYKTLNAIIKNSTTNMVEFVDKDDKSILVITNGKYRFGKFINIEEFPSVDFTFQSSNKWPVPVIASAWNKACIAVSKDVTKLNYQGVYFDGCFAATDNRRLSVVACEGYDGDPMLIPPVFGDILKHCKNEIEVGINPSSNLVVISCHEIGMMACVRLIDAKFADYRDILGKMDPSITISISKQGVLGAISRLLPFTDKLFKVVEVQVVYSKDLKHQLKLSIENKNAGEEYIPIKGLDLSNEEVFMDVVDKTDSDRFVAIGGKYHIDNVCDGVSVVDSDEDVTVHFQEDGKLWITEEQFTYLQASIRD